MGAEPGAQLVFNCQMGRGRTTTGMTVGVMWRSLVGGEDVLIGKKRFGELEGKIGKEKTIHSPTSQERGNGCFN